MTALHREVEDIDTADLVPTQTTAALLRVGWLLSTRRDAADTVLGDLVAGLVSGRPHIARRCSRCGGTDHGRPVVDADGVHLSLSRASGLVVAAVSTVGPVGVDVERAGSAGFAGFEDVAVHPRERGCEPTVTWVRKEAALKATGWGLAIDPRDVWIGDGPSVTSWDERLPSPERCWLRDVPLAPGYVGAVAVIRPAEAPAG